MLRKFFSVLVLATAVASPFFAAFDFTGAANSPGLALTGKVSSTEEGAMEGVLVSANKAGSTVTITVVSNQQGRYQFPAAKLDTGQYSLSIRAAGYDLDGSATAEITPEKTATVDLELRKTRDLASHLTHAEWLACVPGPPTHQNKVLSCVGCHTVERIVRSARCGCVYASDPATHEQLTRIRARRCTAATAPARATPRWLARNKHGSSGRKPNG